MTPPLLIEALRQYLVTAGVVRDPRNAGPLPPCWRSPRLGVPAPGEGNGVEVGPTVVVGLLPAPGVPRAPHDATYLRTDGVDVYIRATSAPAAIALDDLIRAQLVDRRGWTMNGLQIVESSLYRAQSPVGSDAQAFDFVTGYLFERSTA